MMSFHIIHDVGGHPPNIIIDVVRSDFTSSTLTRVTSTNSKRQKPTIVASQLIMSLKPRDKIEEDVINVEDEGTDDSDDDLVEEVVDDAVHQPVFTIESASDDDPGDVAISEQTSKETLQAVSS